MGPLCSTSAGDGRAGLTFVISGQDHQPVHLNDLAALAPTQSQSLSELSHNCREHGGKSWISTATFSCISCMMHLLCGFVQAAAEIDDLFTYASVSQFSMVSFCSFPTAVIVWDDPVSCGKYASEPYSGGLVLVRYALNVPWSSAGHQ